MTTLHGTIIRLYTCFAMLVVASQVDAGQAEGLFAPGTRIVFLGDSITDAGGFITMLDAQLQTAQQENPPKLINLGLPSETCCGLSEPAHPFPRPNVHERLARVLAKAKPDVVFACYGMNDGIYHPFSEDRFAKFQAGLRKLIAECRAAGARVVLLTPPPFDPQPLGKLGKLKPPTGENFSWTRPSKDYDDVIKRYADWVQSMASDDGVETVIDLHTPVVDYVDAKRQSDPDFALSGDGVHIEDEGHAQLAQAIAKQLGLTPIGEPEHYELYKKRQSILHGAWLTHVGHKRPGSRSKLSLAEAQAAAAKITAQIKQSASDNR